MKAQLSRADLARVVAELGSEGLEAVAVAHGYEREVVPQPPKREKARRGRGKAEPESEVARPAEALQPTPFWQPRSIEFHGEDEVAARAWAAAEAAEAAAAAGAWRAGTEDPPESPPLSPWRRLGPILQRALSGEQVGRRVDLRRLVRTVAAGRQIDRLPKLRRRGWMPVEVVLDRPLRLAPFWQDQDRVVRELERVLGRHGVAVRRFTNGPGTEVTGDARPRRRLPSGAPVLALSDLGWYAGEDERLAWLRMARGLEAAGEKLVALVPVPRARWTPEMARAWRAIPWERPVAGGGVEDEGVRAARVDRLLVHLALAMRIERGLLRTIRWLLPRAEADVGVEVDVWVHPVLGAMFPEYRVIEPGEVESLRRRFAAEVPVEDQARVIAAMRAWHWNRARMPEAWHLEVLALEKMLACGAGVSRDEVERAAMFLSWLARDAARQLSDNDEDTLRRWCDFVVEQAPRSMWDPDTQVGEALQRIGFRVGVEVPNADPKLRPGGEDAKKFVPREYRLILRGCSLGVAGDSREGSVLASVVAAEPVLTIASGVVREATVRLDDVEGRVEVHPRGAVELRTDRTTLRLGRLVRPEWAREVGRDEFGLWAELVVAGVAFRMRWIPPGRFLMGSPEGEPGRDDDEGPQYLKTISHGFWLGETPVTQALWEAVVRENPSVFRTPDRPVENVSWKDCQERLIVRLNKGHPTRDRFRLPTEAEWEYACRAGTTTATYAGPIEIIGEYNAPVLDAIAWYGGNSGKDLDLREGEDSSGWPEKQYTHSRAGTRRVGQKQPNPWGLHDMLGNVWEWCSDRATWPMQQHSSTEQTGVYRTIRGGSWDFMVRGLRAAFRNALPPNKGYSYLGLRLARDQAQEEEEG